MAWGRPIELRKTAVVDGVTGMATSGLVARDAVGRGNTVFLCEMNDLASGTSSWSTKLVHGGLRYLEYYEFRLVREGGAASVMPATAVGRANGRSTSASTIFFPKKS